MTTKAAACAVLLALDLLGVGCASAPPGGARGDRPSARQVDVWIAQVRSGTPAERAAAAWALGDARISRPELSLTLQKLLAGGEADEDPELRAAALWALHRAADPALVVLAQASDRPGQAPPDYDVRPRLIKPVLPVYPPEALAAGIEGTVKLALLVDAQGRVALADLRASVPALDKAAFRTVAAWRFIPARRDGHPVATPVIAPVSFSAN